jgi:hypothetical protein
LEAIDRIRFGFSHKLDSLEGALLKYSLLPGINLKSTDQDDGFVGGMNEECACEKTTDR